MLSVSALLVVVLAFAPPASAAPKGIADIYGQVASTNGSGPGEFGTNGPRGVAVYEVTGQVFAVDGQAHRVHRFAADGTFEMQIDNSFIPGPFVPFNNPGGVAIDQDNGWLYVSDRNSRRVLKFDVDGNFIGELGGVGTAEGQFGQGNATGAATSFNGHLAVDDDGFLYVADPVNNRVQKFAPGTAASVGSFVGMFGWGVEDGTAALQVCESGCQAGLPGPGNGQFGSGAPGGPTRVAVDSAGDVYALEPGTSNNRVQKFELNTAADGSIDAIASVTADWGALAGSFPHAIAIDRDDDHVFVARRRSSASNAPVTVAEREANGSVVDAVDHGVDTGIGNGSVTAANMNSFAGLAVNSGNSDIVVPDPDAASSGGRRVYILNEVTGPLETAFHGATQITASTATLAATIQPNGSRTRYRFEYSKDGVEFDSVPIPAGDVGRGNGAIEIAQSIEGLDANTFYRAYLVATRADGDEVTTAEQTFLTDPSAPVVETMAPRQVADTTVQLVGRVNPGGAATTHWFEWGNESYGNTVPVPAASTGAGGAAKIVGQTLSGLRPESHYHYRVCAQNALAVNPVCGGDRAFQTRAVVRPPALGRAYEMVTAPDKPLRQGFPGGADTDARDFSRFNSALPSTDGESVKWGTFPGATSGDAGHGFSFAEAYEIYRRGVGGWHAEAVVNVPPVVGATNGILEATGTSADLLTSSWSTNTYMFDNGPNGTGSKSAVRVMGDKGGPRGAGWYPWLDPSWTPGLLGADVWAALIDDEGERLVGFARTSASAATRFRDARPADGGAAPQTLQPAQTSGSALFLASAAADWRPGDLVNECTGTVTAGDRTSIVSREGSGVPGDKIGARDCEVGSPTDVRGAAFPASGHGHLNGSAITAMSRSGDRVFFLSPDPVPVGSIVPSTGERCGTATGASTACPPQLFVRQYDDEGNATVRWLTRAEDALFDAPQEVGLLGNGVAFEGASRDGDVVYFRTNAPLTVDDPNGGDQVSGGHTSGGASSRSWDLYRYELGSNDADPAPIEGDPGDRLTRVSGGPTGDADPNTNCEVVATSGADQGSCSGAAASTGPNGRGTVVRFMSDDGNRVYFVTAAEIPGAMNAPPAGGATTPTTTDAQVNADSRNLYAYDARKAGAAAYEFVARLPFSANDTTGPQGELEACASFASNNQGSIFNVTGSRNELQPAGGNCVHGTSSGDAIVLQTTAQLTVDDVDSAADVYLYEGAADRLTRISAPPPGSSPYVCHRFGLTEPVRASCNGDMGMAERLSSSDGEFVGLAGRRHWNIAEHPDGTLKAVHFQSRLALTSDDVNGAGAFADTGGEGVMDVYEWRDGKLMLISPGDTQDSAFYSGNSRDGNRVFFWTERPISAREIDSADGDLYAAVVGGGFPGPSSPPLLCELVTDGCQDSGAAPTPVSPQTSMPGGGNASPGLRRALAVLGVSRRTRARASRTGVLSLRIRTNAAGGVSIVAKAKIASRAETVARKTVRIRRAGITTVRLRLSRPARRALRSGRKLRLTVEARQVGTRIRTRAVLLQGAQP